jgi:hypothetical protein
MGGGASADQSRRFAFVVSIGLFDSIYPRLSVHWAAFGKST